MDERHTIELKRDIDLQITEQKLKLVKEVVALANADGGQIIIGVDNDGTQIGVHDGRVRSLDAARINDVVRSFIEPDSIEVSVTTEPLGDGATIVRLNVPKTSRPPLVFSKDGNFASDTGAQKSLFAAHSVFVRQGTKAEPARWTDYRRWIDDAVQAAQDSFMDKVGLLVQAAPDSDVRILDGDRFASPPRFLLEQSAALFEQRPEKLLTGDDLLHLWKNRASLALSGSATELLIQSALRKRATLFLWLWFLEPTEEQVARYLENALVMKDRDKSDAAKAILQAAAIYLGETKYLEIAGRLARSPYSHMRDASSRWPCPNDALNSLARLRMARHEGLSETRLVTSADSEAREEEPSSKRLSSLGIELLALRQSLPAR